MNKEFKIYHVETQEDYDDLMIKLEKEGYMWASGDKPTSKNYWWEYTGKTVIYLGKWGEGKITRSNLSEAKGNHSTIPIIKHKADKKDKAKGVEQMEKVVVPQFVADWYERNKKGYSLYGLLRSFAEDYYLLPGLQEWVKNYNLKENDAQDILAKMYLFQNYEVEEEKKYYWRKKKEHYLSTEYDEFPKYIQLDLELNAIFSSKNTREIQGYKVKFNENEMMNLVSKEDFNKLEKVEIADDEC